MPWKRIAIGIALAAAAIALGYAIFLLFFRRAPEPEAPPPSAPIPIVPTPLPPAGIGVPLPPGGIVPEARAPEAPTPGAEPAAVASGARTEVRAITEHPAAFAALTPSGELDYYDAASGRFYRTGASGKPVAITDAVFPRVETVTWSPDHRRALLEFPDGANVAFDFAAKRQTTLPQHWTAFSFSPSGDRIAGKSIGLDRSNRWLFEADANGNSFQPIEALGDNAARVTTSWSPNNQVVAFSRTGDALGGGRQQVLLIGRNGENFPSLTIEGQDFRPLWSQSGSRILYSAVSAASDFTPELWVVDGNGNTAGANRRRLLVRTWADKCAFAGDAAVYCAVPNTLERGYGLEPKLAATVPDHIERIDLATGLRTVVGQPANDATITRLLVAPDVETLYFTSGNDGRAYAMRLR